MKYYSEDHIWIDVEDEEGIVGISAFLAEELGPITYVELPREDEDFIIGDRLGVIETGKESMDLYCPVSGTISAVNDCLEDDPSIIDSSPEVKGWLFKLSNIDISELDDMMNEAGYNKYIQSLLKQR